MTTRLILAHVRARAGDAAVGRVLAASGVAHTLDHLEDERSWCSYEDKIALLRAAGRELGDPSIGRRVGESIFDERIGSGLRLLISALGSPRQVLRSVARANTKFTTSATMSTESAGARGGVVTYRLHDPHRPDRLDCDYTQGLLSQVPVLFGLPPARIEHPACQVEGGPVCRYEVRWAARRLRDRLDRRGHEVTEPFEAEAFREQLADLQRTVADLVSTPDLGELLQRIADRAAAGVRGQRYLLAVELEGERAPRYHAEGLADGEAAELGAALLAGTASVGQAGDVARMVTEVRSTRRRYGWLAAELPAGHDFLPGEQDQLDAFGRLAAAALDAATALEAAQRRQRRAEALLQLGHELAREDGERGVARRVCAAVPIVLGAARAMVMLWDDELHGFRVAAHHGFAPGDTRPVTFTVRHEDATDVVAEMSRAPRQRWFTPGDPLPEGGAVEDWDASVIATAPIVVRGRFAALLIALWDADEPPLTAPASRLGQLAALGDQATTALTAARALAEARHRATHDALTGLANRVLFNERIEQALAEARRSGRPPGVCFIDLDGFKQVNDTEGHAVGDRLLIEVGHRILATIRESDAAARLSGDEFGVLLRGLETPTDAELVAEKLVEVLGAPYRLDGRDLHVGASIGVATVPPEGATADQLLIAADAAMYRAKAHRGAFRVAGDEDLRSA